MILKKEFIFYIIYVPCLCSVNTDSMIIPATIGSCNNDTNTVKLVHLENVALIQHFFSSETYNSILGDTTFTASAVKMDEAESCGSVVKPITSTPCK